MLLEIMLNTTRTVVVIIWFLYLSSIVISSNRLLDRLFLPASLTGPESLAFDSIGGGPYTGVSDGRIFKYEASNGGFLEFAHVTPDRNTSMCDGISDISTLQETCGRPLGLGFHFKTGDLYIADAYYGLMSVPYDGGEATQVVSNDAQGNPFGGFLAGLDVDPQSGIVYFTQASSSYKIRDIQKLLNSTDRSGSLYRYDPNTDELTLLLSDLAVPSGVAVNNNGSFILVSECTANRIQRFWLTGPNANTSEIFLQLPGRPDNIKRNSGNEFWVAVNYPFGIPPPPTPPVLPLALRFNEDGFVLQAISLIEEFGTETVSEVQEYGGKLYATSMDSSYANILTP